MPHRCIAQSIVDVPLDRSAVPKESSSDVYSAEPEARRDLSCASRRRSRGGCVRAEGDQRVGRVGYWRNLKEW